MQHLTGAGKCGRPNGLTAANSAIGDQRSATAHAVVPVVTDRARHRHGEADVNRLIRVSIEDKMLIGRIWTCFYTMMIKATCNHLIINKPLLADQRTISCSLSLFSYTSITTRHQYTYVE